MGNPEAGPAAYLLLRGEGDRRAQTGPPGSASFLHLAVLHLRPAPFATASRQEQIFRGLEDCPDGLAELRSVLLQEHEWRVREGLV
jgi:hypothetical protein